MQRRATRPAPVPSGGRKKKRSGSEESAKSVVEVKEEPVVVQVNEKCPTQDETDAAIASLLEECKSVNNLSLSPLDLPLDPGFCDGVADGTQQVNTTSATTVQFGDPPVQVVTPSVGPAQPFLDQLVTRQQCPFHKQDLTCIDPDNEFDLLCLKCPELGCLTFVNEENAEQILELLWNTTDPEIVAQWMTLVCFCGRRPFLKLSKSAKNPNRLFLCCPRKSGEYPCKFFQWVDQPPYQPRRDARPPGQTMRQSGPYTRYPYPHESYFRRMDKEEVDCPGDQDQMRRAREDVRRNFYQQERRRAHEERRARGGQHLQLSERLELHRCSGSLFEQQCQRNNEERKKCGLPPYSMETFRRYGSGIF